MNSFLFNSNYFNSYFNYSSNSLKENGYNVLTDHCQIKSPNLNEIRKNLYFVTTNQIFSKIWTKGYYNCSKFRKRNCFFKTISHFFDNQENYHYHYIKLIAELIFSKFSGDKIKYPFMYYNNKSIITVEENFNKLIITGHYVDQYEIINTSLPWKINICIYKNEFIYEEKKILVICMKQWYLIKRIIINIILLFLPY